MREDVVITEVRTARAVAFGPNREPSAIAKIPVQGPVAVAASGLDGDEQGDTRHRRLSREPGAGGPAPCIQPWRSRTCCAATTMLRSAGVTSSQLRVLSPQSGFTHNRSTGLSSAARSSSRTISSTVGVRGEWMS